MNDAVVSIIVIVIFSIIGGFFAAAAETALVTLRESQVSRLANTRGRRGARFSCTSQRIRIDSSQPCRWVSRLPASFRRGTAPHGSCRTQAPVLEDIGLSQGVAESVAFIPVTILIAYISLSSGSSFPSALRSNGQRAWH